MVDIALKCGCGAVEGKITDVVASSSAPIVCYCKDCQAFAHYLEQGDDILTKEGGTEVLQIYPCQFQITKGVDKLQSMRLTHKGLLRWYTSCCKTPVANTISSKMAFTGVIHSLISDKQTLQETCGPIRHHIMGKYALGKPDGVTLSEKFPPGVMMRVVYKLMFGRLLGKAKPNILFQADGKPIAKPVIASAEPVP